MSDAPGPIWMVPRRPDPDFVGRTATQPAGIHGLGGVGKTLLAVEFAHRHADTYDAVFWLAAENPTTLAPAFAELAREEFLGDEHSHTIAPRKRLREIEESLQGDGRVEESPGGVSADSGPGSAPEPG
jgi:hypothetical protein